MASKELMEDVREMPKNMNLKVAKDYSNDHA